MAPAQLSVLDSGVRVVTEEVPSVRSVALGLWVRTGSRNETAAQAGVSHFLEHLLFKGTERYSAIQIAERFDGLGASVNAATGKETTDLHARFLDEHTDEVFRLLAEMLLAPTFRKSIPSVRSCSRRSRCTRTSRRIASTTCWPRPSSRGTRSGGACSARPR
jgi:predicted Zn-dependent peptidase